MRPLPSSLLLTDFLAGCEHKEEEVPGAGGYSQLLPTEPSHLTDHLPTPHSRAQTQRDGLGMDDGEGEGEGSGVGPLGPASLE